MNGPCDGTAVSVRLPFDSLARLVHFYDDRFSTSARGRYTIVLRFAYYVTMAPFSDYTKRQMLYYHSKGHCAPTIAKYLAKEGIVASCRGVYA